MFWYWKVRIYFPNKCYAHAQIKTEQRLDEIDKIQSFYKELTGERMLLEGMQELPYDLDCVGVVFQKYYKGSV